MSTPIRRGEFLVLTGLTLTGFNNLSRRGLLPFRTRLAGGRGWSAYTIEQAILVAVADGLAGAGLAREVARTAVVTLQESARLGALVRSGNGFVGCATIGGLETAVTLEVAGDLAGVAGQVDRYLSRFRQAWIQAIVLFEIGDSLHRLRARAANTDLAPLLEHEITRFGSRR